MVSKTCLRERSWGWLHRMITGRATSLASAMVSGDGRWCFRVGFLSVRRFAWLRWSPDDCWRRSSSPPSKTMVVKLAARRFLRSVHGGLTFTEVYFAEFYWFLPNWLANLTEIHGWLTAYWKVLSQDFGPKFLLKKNSFEMISSRFEVCRCESHCWESLLFEESTARWTVHSIYRLDNLVWRLEDFLVGCPGRQSISFRTRWSISAI